MNQLVSKKAPFEGLLALQVETKQEKSVVEMTDFIDCVVAVQIVGLF
jgi:hypothetical protein